MLKYRSCVDLCCSFVGDQSNHIGGVIMAIEKPAFMDDKDSFQYKAFGAFLMKFEGKFIALTDDAEEELIDRVIEILERFYQTAKLVDWKNE